jgi:hypothetical protein
VKKLLALIFLGLIVFVLVYRQRVFVRNPLATVTRDGVKVGDTRVMINYSNDVLLDDASVGKRRIYIVQNWDKVAKSMKSTLRCIQGLACMTESDQAAGVPVAMGSRGRRSAFEGVTMTNKRVEFVDEDGALVEVVLR